MIAYFFPPEGNAGAYRPLRFVQHLPSFGWQPTVVTLETNLYERFDPSLSSRVPTEVEVIRVRGHDPWQALQAKRGRRIQERISQASAETIEQIRLAHHMPFRSFIREAMHTLEACSYHPDMAMPWIRPAVTAIVELCGRTKVDVICATAPPWSSFLVAGRSSQRTGLPYVLDFRDSWTMTYTVFERKRPV